MRTLLLFTVILLINAVLLVGVRQDESTARYLVYHHVATQTLPAPLVGNLHRWQIQGEWIVFMATLRDRGPMSAWFGWMGPICRSIRATIRCSRRRLTNIRAKRPNSALSNTRH